MQYRIASFNIRNFSVGASKDLKKIAKIIYEENLDIVALQEILSEGKGVERLLNECKAELYGWDYCFASPGESSDPSKITDMILHDKRGEGYAFLWNTKKFKLLEYSKLGKKRIFEPRIINSLSNDVNGVRSTSFARAPHYIRLQPQFGGFFELRLINIHIYYGSSNLTDIAKRKIEYDLLVQEIYPQLSQKRYGTNRAAFTIAMGDYNLSLFDANVPLNSRNCCIPDVYNYYLSGKPIQVLTIQKERTTIRGSRKLPQETVSEKPYVNNYDHFTYSPELSSFRSVFCDALDVINKYCDGDIQYYRENISDHIPIVITVEI